METCVTIADSLDRFRVNIHVLHGEKKCRNYEDEL